ncbi:MAG TPA: hypothetical protein VEO95_11725, partial [Chthoniobacteraceae bacterium]|nr:hypothetical protein [Chthoniobacteraceae bacterium]
DASGNTYYSGGFVGSLDLDPAGSLRALTSEGAHDIVVAKFAPPNVFDAAHLRTFHDADGDLVKLQLTGPGTATYSLVGGTGDLADLAQLSLADTSPASALSINVTPFGNGDGKTIAQKILTTQPLEHLSAITLGKTVTLGDGTGDAVPDLHVSGEIKTLTLGDIAANTIIQLGDTLPYNIATDTTTPDTYNNHPDLTIGDVMGAGVQINVIGDGVTPHGDGGGGLGNVVIGSWAFPGFIRTTQSIGDFTVLNDLNKDFLAVLQVDSNLGVHLGSPTVADSGNMAITNGGKQVQAPPHPAASIRNMKISGAWGGTGSEIAGDVKSFDADKFLHDATLTAASMGKVNIDGDFDGTLKLLDPDSPGIPTATVGTDFTGTVITASPLQKLKINGDFTGSLQAKSIGSISAYLFFGAHDGMGDPTTYIKTTGGGLGTITASKGPITDYTLDTTLVFKGFKVNLANVAFDTIGLDNVHITAASIGNISVSLKAAPKSTGVDLIGIRDSTFTTTATGTTKAAAGNIGAITVTLAGAPAGTSAVGIQNSVFDALAGTSFSPLSTVNALGNVSVKISGQAGANTGLDRANFSANTIGTVTVNVSRYPDLHVSSAAQAIAAANITATGAIGAMSVSGDATLPQVSDLKVWAGGNVGAVTVKSKTAANGTLQNSAILAGQLLDLTPSTDPHKPTTAQTQLAKLALAKLGAVNVSGSLTSTNLVAGASIGEVTAGGDVTDSLVLAGAMLGADRIVSGDDVYQRAASIAALTVVKGTFARTSVAAGVDPHDGTFGNGDDLAAPVVAFLTTKTSSIGPITLAAGSASHANGTLMHNYAIEAAALASLKLGATPVPLTMLPLFLHPASTGEDAADVLVRSIG